MVIVISCSENSNSRRKPWEEGREFNLEKMAERQTDEIAEILSLTDEQKKDVLEINKDFMNKISDIRGEENIDKKDRRALFMELNKDKEKAFQGVLTKEQYTTWEKVREELRPVGRRRNSNE